MKNITLLCLVDYREIPGPRGKCLRDRLFTFGFQSLHIQPPGWIEELFHPDFNFKFPSWMARLITRTSTSQQELTFKTVHYNPRVFGYRFNLRRILHVLQKRVGL